MNEHELEHQIHRLERELLQANAAIRVLQIVIVMHWVAIFGGLFFLAMGK